MSLQTGGGVDGMVVTERIEINGIQYIRTTSTVGNVARDGAVYDEAIDPIGSDLIYTEVPVEVTQDEIAEALEEIL